MPRAPIETRTGDKRLVHRDAKGEFATVVRRHAAWFAAALLLAGCSAAPRETQPPAYAEPGCRDATTTITVMVDRHPVTRQWRECQQPDGSWRSVTIDQDEPVRMARRSRSR
jgi:hypothetical protein